MLRSTNIRALAKLLFQRPLANFAYEPNKTVFSYEGNTENNDKYQKISYTAPLKGKYKMKKERDDFNRLKNAIREKMEREMKGETGEQKVIEQTDVLFRAGEEPVHRKIDKSPAKEMYFIPRIDNLYDYNNRKISYLNEFIGPFEIHDARVTSLLESVQKRLEATLKTKIMNYQEPDFNSTDVLQSDPEIVKALQELADVIPMTNYRLYPNIALYLAYNLRYKQDFAKVWAAMEQELFKVVHNMSTIEIAKLKYALGGIFPKAGSPKLHRTLLDIAVGDLNSANASELLHLFHAFRTLSKDRIYTKIVGQFLTKGKVLVKNEPDLLANILYTYANCRLKKHQRLHYRDPIEELREAHKLLEYYLPEIEAAIPVMSNESLVRLSLAVMLVRTKDYKDIIAKIERTVKKKVGEFDAFQTANLIYAFSKMNEGQSAGKNAFYEDFEKNVFKFKDEFNDLEKSRIFYAYANRALLSKDMKEKVILPWVDANIEKFNYIELANVAYGLMFIENTDKEIWRRFARNVCLQKYRCPINLYAPIKIARYYLDAHFPQWDYSQYEDTCFQAERYFNTGRLQNQAANPEYVGLHSILRYDIEDNDFRYWLEWENLFIVDFAKPQNKFGIIIKTERDCLPGTNEAKPIFKLKKKILEKNDWMIMELDWKAFSEMGPEVRVNWLKGEVEKYTKKTEARKQAYEKYRREEVFNTLAYETERISIGNRRTNQEELIEKLKMMTKDA